MILASTKCRLLKYLDYKGISRAEFYEKTEIKRGLLDKDKLDATISDVFLAKIIAVFKDLNIKWLITGKGEMLFNQSIEQIEKNEAIAHAKSKDKGIPLIPITAFAGFGLEPFNDIQIEDYYIVPDFRQADFLMRIKGDSMYPKYASGDIVACSIIEETLFFQWNKIYAIYTKSQGVLVKRVKHSSLQGYIKLISDNIQYDPFDVPISDIDKIALVIGVIRIE